MHYGVPEIEMKDDRTFNSPQRQTNIPANIDSSARIRITRRNAALNAVRSKN